MGQAEVYDGHRHPEHERVEDSCGCVFCDIGLTPTKVTKGWVHFGPNGQHAPCHNPDNK